MSETQRPRDQETERPRDSEIQRPSDSETQRFHRYKMPDGVPDDSNLHIIISFMIRDTEKYGQEVNPLPESEPGNEQIANDGVDSPQ